MMQSKRLINSPVFISIVPAVLVIIALAVGHSVYAARLPKQGSLVSPAEVRARDAFRANWQAINAQEQTRQGTAQIPVSGNSAAQAQVRSQRSIAAEAARWNGIAAQERGRSPRSIAADAARWNGIAAQESERSPRSIAAEAARWNGIAAQELGSSLRSSSAP